VKMVEAGIDSAQERLENFKILKKLGNKATLRLRPFIIGVSDPSYIDLIKKSIKYGIDSVSLEFLCLEERSKNIAEQQYKKISDACGFDVFKFYKQNSSGAGYLRLNYKTKIKYANEIIKLCKRNKVRLAVSDAHLKTLGNCGCCCGVPENWKFFRGQLTNAIQICKKQNKGVTFEDLKPDIDLFKKIKFEKAKGFNTTSNKKRAVFREFSLYDLIRNKWNQPKKGGSPFKYTDKRFIPVKVDKKKNVMYEIR